ATVVPGQRVSIRVTGWTADSDSTRRLPFVTAAGGGVSSDTTSGAAANANAGSRLSSSRSFVWVLPDSLAPTIPYFLQLPRIGAMYQWPVDEVAVWGDPFEPPPVVANPYDSRDIWGSVEVTYRTNNPAQGELRRPLTVVPRIDVKLDPADGVWALGSPAAHDFTVTLTHGASDPTSGTVRLELPEGWPQVKSQLFRFTTEDERQSFGFQVHAPVRLAAGSYEVRAIAEDGKGGRYDQGIFTVDYPHIRPRTYPRASVARINVAAIVMPRLARVGYIRGAADEVPEALGGAGVPIELLDRAILAHGDLSKYSAIVIGPRAYEVDTALVQNNARLLDYVRRGGLLLVQYQQQPFYRGGFAPAPISLAAQGPADRVTDETAAVKSLAPTDPALTTPNRIAASDWDGWIQERGLYFPHSWDKSYRPLLEMHDPGEAPLQGGLLVSRVGKGTYVLTGLSFFRQLPAGVPGAFRLFANLLALQPAATP
ncbi:MAG: NEW3 domain-containing protein, partial [Gemmatimonadota bacterium]